ncbi:hypothetical protein GJAV_G00092920 [Gymnothorax javanicus]|nr:hypothetical protein GJAV_G00092920 [Gymnothorax javanicus]
MQSPGLVATASMVESHTTSPVEERVGEVQPDRRHEDQQPVTILRDTGGSSIHTVKCLTNRLSPSAGEALACKSSEG